MMTITSSRICPAEALLDLLYRFNFLGARAHNDEGKGVPT